jgi:hypothetical protein
MVATFLGQGKNWQTLLAKLLTFLPQPEGTRMSASDLSDNGEPEEPISCAEVRACDTASCGKGHLVVR